MLMLLAAKQCIETAQVGLNYAGISYQNSGSVFGNFCHCRMKQSVADQVLFAETIRMA